MGVDSVPHPSCVDEPLFSMLPIPYEVLYFFAIGRQEWARKKWAAPTPGEDEAGEEAKIETELTPVEEGKSVKFEEQRPSEAPPEASERSQRPGLILQSVRS